MTCKQPAPFKAAVPVHIVTHKLLNYLTHRHPIDNKQTLVENLTDRELGVLALAGKGRTNKAIGVQLGISDRTTQGHLVRIYAKLEAGSRTEAVMRAVALGLITSPAAHTKPSH